MELLPWAQGPTLFHWQVFIVPIGQRRKRRVRVENQMHQDPAVGK